MTLTQIRHKVFADKNKLAQLGLKKIIYFGSYARGEQTPQSDLDLIVEFEPGKKNFDNFMQTCDYLESLLGLSVEVLTPESVSPYLKPYIEKEAVYEKL